MKFLLPTTILISTALTLALSAPPPSIQHPTLTHHNSSDLDHSHYTHTSPIWSELSGHASPHPSSHTNTTSHHHYIPSRQLMTPDDAIKEELEAILSAKGTASAPRLTESTSSRPSYHLPTLTTLGVKSTATNQLGYVQKPAQVFSASAKVWQTKTLTQSKPVATHHLWGY